MANPVLSETVADSLVLTKDQKQRKFLLNELKNTANKLNGSLNIPVEWTVGRYSNIEINNMCAVQHILLLKPLSSGIIKRKSGDFLCGRLIVGNNNKFESKFYDGEGQLYPAPVCCKDCLRIAKRWEKK